MRHKLFLHMGTHKTGTTFVQNFMHENRVHLDECGITYADYDAPGLEVPESLRRPISHHHFARAVKDADWVLSERDGLNLIEYWKAALAPRNALMLSAESMSFHQIPVEGSILERRQAYLLKLKEWLSDFDVTPVLVLRAPDEYMRSMFEEKTTKGFGKSFTFAEFVAQFNAPGTMARYFESVEMIDDVFGAATLIDYGCLQEQQAYARNFFRLLGVDLDDAVTESWQRVRTRESLGIIKSLLKSNVNDAISSRKDNARVVEWFRTDQKLGARIATLYGDSACNVWKTVDGYEEILAQRRADVERLLPRFSSHDPVGLRAFLERDLSRGVKPSMDESLATYANRSVSMLLWWRSLVRRVLGLLRTSRRHSRSLVRWWPSWRTEGRHRP